MEDGIIDFEAIVKELVRQGYKGNIALEYVCVNYRGCYDLDVITETMKLKNQLTEIDRFKKSFNAFSDESGIPTPIRRYLVRSG